MASPIADVIRDLLLQADAPLKDAEKLLPRTPRPGSPEAVAAWRIGDLRARIRLTRDAWDPPAEAAS